MSEQGGNKFVETGKDVFDEVQQAINSGDFSSLSRNIQNTVNGAMGSTYWQVDTRTSSRYAESGKTRYRGTSTSARYGRQNGQQSRPQNRPRPAQAAQVPKLHAAAAPGKISGLAGEITGFSVAAIFGLTTLVALATQAGLGLFCVFAAITAGSFALGLIGKSSRNYAKRYVRYIGVLQKKGYATFEELGQSVGCSADAAKKDLKKMLGQKLFYQGHIDEQETTFMMTDEAYQLYQGAQQSLKNRQSEEKAASERREKLHLTPEAEKMIEEGRTYIRHIRECNAAIPGEEISEKLYHLESIMQRIFDQVEKQPELVTDLRKFMNYYLPTTDKLVEAYRELDAQPIQGENITTAKKEIEESLDVINEAFEKLLDGFFEEKAWDISSDISVMKTMLAQEGLTKQDDFKVTAGGQ